jgi:hypothetical protein
VVLCISPLNAPVLIFLKHSLQGSFSLLQTIEKTDGSNLPDKRRKRQRVMNVESDKKNAEPGKSHQVHSVSKKYFNLKQSLPSPSYRSFFLCSNHKLPFLRISKSLGAELISHVCLKNLGALLIKKPNRITIKPKISYHNTGRRSKGESSHYQCPRNIDKKSRHVEKRSGTRLARSKQGIETGAAF